MLSDSMSRDFTLSIEFAFRDNRSQWRRIKKAGQFGRPESVEGVLGFLYRNKSLARCPAQCSHVSIWDCCFALALRFCCIRGIAVSQDGVTLRRRGWLTFRPWLFRILQDASMQCTFHCHGSAASRWFMASILSRSIKG